MTPHGAAPPPALPPPPRAAPAPGGAGEGGGHAPHPRSRGLGTAVRARSPQGRLSGSRCFGTAGWGGRQRIRPSFCLSIRPSLRGRRLVGVCVTDTAAGQPPARGEPGGWRGDDNDNAGAPRLRQPRLRPPQPSPAGATSAASLLLLPPGGISHSVSIS